jgi:hypothetical protein
MKVVKFSSYKKTSYTEYVVIPDGIYILIFDDTNGAIRKNYYEICEAWFLDGRKVRTSPLGFYYAIIAPAIIVRVKK